MTASGFFLLLLISGGCIMQTLAADACTCDDAIKPVCGKDGNTYKNSCKAKCAGAAIKHKGPCGSKEFACKKCADTKAVWDPVCLVSGGPRKVPTTYANPCYTLCKAKVPSISHAFYKGECKPECTAKCAKAPGMAVCCGKGEEYPSQCYASCVGGYSDAEIAKCTSVPCLGDQAMGLLMPGDSLCPAGAAAVMCIKDPCQGKTCPEVPTAQCFSNYCTHKWLRLEKHLGPCEAAWMDTDSGHLAKTCDL